MVQLDQGGRHGDHPLIAPPPALRHVVEHFWVHRAGPKGVRRIVPDPSPHVIFWTARTPRGLLASCRIVGARSTFFDASMARELTIGARLRPGVLPQAPVENPSKHSG